MAPRPRARLLFGSEILPQALEAVLTKPRRRFGYTELSNLLAAPSPESLYRALNRAVELGLIRRDPKGGRYGTYTANTRSPLYRDVRRLLTHLDLSRPAGAYQPDNLATLGARLAGEPTPGSGPALPAGAHAWIHQFIDDFEASRRPAQRKLLETEPQLTGNHVLDAYLAGLAEHLAGRAGLPAPRWTEGRDRFLTRWWLEGDLPSERPTALATSPAAFRRRGIFVAQSSLTRV